MKGIILAGGIGSRLWPSTKSVSKQLIPIYDKPMAYYPLSTMMLAGIREILIISDPESIDGYRRLFGNGRKIGLKVDYEIQNKPAGIPEAFTLGEAHIGGQSCCLVLGDNLFHGRGMSEILQKATNQVERNGGAHLFTASVVDPERFGVAEVDHDGKIIGIQEKPSVPKSKLAVTGLYMYGPDVVGKTRELMPGSRGELEITDLNMKYIKEGMCGTSHLGRGTTWLDTGTPDSLQSAANYVSSVQMNTGKMIACIEEVAWRMGFIDDEMLIRSVEGYPPSNEYYRYVNSLLG